MPDIFVWKGRRKKFNVLIFWSSVRSSSYWTHRTQWTLLGSEKIPTYPSSNKIFCLNVGLGEGRERGVVSQKTCYFSGRCWAVNSRCLKLYRGYSISFYSSNVGELFWSWILKDCIKVQEKKKESCCLGFLSSTTRGIMHFHVVVVKRRLRNVQKIKSVMHVQSCCFANINLLLLCRSRCRRRRRCLSSLLLVQDGEFNSLLHSRF